MEYFIGLEKATTQSALGVCKHGINIELRT